MRLLMTNGENYIYRNSNNGIIKTKRIEEAEIFTSIYKAVGVMNKAPKRTKSYYLYDMESGKICWERHNRKKFSEEKRQQIYSKANGKCQLCGRQLTLEDMTVDHITPLAMGGDNKMENLQCTCKTCNQFKDKIKPDDFMNRVTEIFLYQMEKKCHGNFRWRIIQKMLMKIL